MALERTTIVASALDLLDQTGLDGLTMRRLADALDVQAPSLYWHFPSKPALLDAMANALLETVARSPEPATDFRATLRLLAGELRSALQSRRDGARVYAGASAPRDNAQRLAQSMIGALNAGGFEQQIATRAAFSLLHYVLGFVIEAQAWHKQATLDPAASPHLPADDEDARFAFGVDLILAGLSGHRASEADQMAALIRAFKAQR